MRKIKSHPQATLVMTSVVAAQLESAAALDVETAGVMLVSIAPSNDGLIRLLCRKLIWVPDSAYMHRDGIGLSIASEGYVHALAEAEALHAIPLWVHTHPGALGHPEPSSADKIVDTQISELFRIRANTEYYGTLIVSPRPNGLAFSGTLSSNETGAMAISRLCEFGERFRIYYAVNSDVELPGDLFDRNVRALGSSIQQVLSGLRVAIVGCGGTGSAVAEQLVRLGVRQFTLVDPDELSLSNVTRVYGSTPNDVGSAKVEVLQAHLRRVAPDAICHVTKGAVVAEAVARSLSHSDVIFGCTDDNAGRMVLSRISTYFIIPVIDCGVLISADSSGRLVGIDGRVTILAPGAACLLCRGRIDVQRASAELMTADEYLKREKEGYAPSLGRVEPAVVAFTTAVASAAVTELLERFLEYGPAPRPSEVLLRFHEREISTNRVEPRPGHYCDPNSGKIGAGFTKPFLEQIWLN
jgi:ThiF family protein